MNAFLLDGFLAVGSWNPNSAKAEHYNFVTSEWTTVQDYPFCSRSVAMYVMAYVPDTSAYYVIGGLDSNDLFHDLATIGMLKNDVWSDAGQLKVARHVSLCYLCSFKVTQF